MPVSKMDIWNAALARLGQDVRVAIPTERTKYATALNASWDRVLDFVLSDGVWPFAITSAVLGMKSPVYPGWMYRYAYPADCLNALAVSDEYGARQYRDAYVIGGVVNGPEFEVQYGSDGACIVTDQIGASLIYVSRVTETDRFPPMFVEAVACRLALDIAPVIAAELGIRLGPSLEQKYMQTKMRAQAQQYNESNERMSFVSMTLESRG